MSAHTTSQRIGSEDAAPESLAGHVARVELGIKDAERMLEEQEQLLRQAARSGHDTARARFDLQKMQLLLALLREGRTRLLQRAAEPK